MADQAISELLAAATVTQSDLFVLEQNGTAKKLTGQTLINDLLRALDGHGGIQSITKVNTDVLQDTYRILFADTTFVDFVVTNGRGVTSITKTNTVDLVDYYSINYNDGSSQTFEVANGAKGDQGDASYVWIKYASQKPTDSSSSFGDLPDDWMGVHVGTEPSAPTDYSQYTWFKIKGEQGDTGAPATLVYTVIEYQASTSGTIIPSGTWTKNVPVVPQGKYLWTRFTQRFNTGDDVVAYTISRMGLDGLGSVVSVAGISPNEVGNVPLTAADIEALPSTGGSMTGPINMNGQQLLGLNAPSEATEAARKSYVDAAEKRATSVRNLLDNSDFRNPVNQRDTSSYTGNGYTIDRWRLWNASSGEIKVNSGGGGITLTANGGMSTFSQCFEQGVLDDGKSYTLAYMTTEGLIIDNNPVKTLGSEEKYVEISVESSNVTVLWAALYEGEYTAETLPPYLPKERADEIYACKQYLRKYRNWAILGTGYIDWEGNVWIVLSNYEPMRIIPTASNLTTGTIVTYNGVYISNINVTPRVVMFHNQMYLSIDSRFEGKAGACVLVLGDDDFYLNAEL